MKKIMTIGCLIALIGLHAMLAQNHSTFFEQLNIDNKLRMKKVDREILRWYADDMYGIKDDSLGWNLPGVLTNKGLEAFFEPSDLQAIEKQYAAIKDSLWQPQDFSDFKLLDSTGIRKITKRSLSKWRKSRNNYAYAFSVPLFSQDRQTVIVKKEFFCGFLCSTQCIYVYRKSEGKWTEVYSYMCWSS